MNVSAGDLAYIVGDLPSRGTVVEVVCYEPEFSAHYKKPTWQCKSKMAVQAFLKGKATTLTPGEPFNVSDFHLRRIAGPSIDVSEIKSEGIPA